MAFERSVELDLPYADAVTRTKEALAGQGFGILTEVDMQATLLAKRQAQIEPYVILGACNPELAEAALAADPRIGVLLPCSVVVRSLPAGRSAVHVFDPDLISQVTDDDALRPYAERAGRLIDAALAELGRVP